MREHNAEYCRKYYDRHYVAIRIHRKLKISLPLARYMVQSGLFPNTVRRIVTRRRSKYP